MAWLDPLAAFLPQNWPLFALVATRLGGLFLLAPWFSMATVPVRVRSAVVALLAVLMTPGLRSPFPITDAAEMPVMIATEMLIGMAIGMAAAAFFAGIALAGEIIGTQMGLSAAAIFDPSTNVQIPVIGNLVYLFSMTVYLMLDGHLILLRALHDSFQAIPPGGGVGGTDGLFALAQMGGVVFETALRVAAPVMVALLLVNVALGVLAKAAPQMNVFMFAFPVTIALGLLVVGAILPPLASLVSHWTAGLPDLAERTVSVLRGR